MTGNIITHRISKIVNLGDGYGFVTKGDSNNIEDETIVRYDQVIGKVIITMPKFGKLIKLLKNKIFFCSCVIILVTILIYDIRVKKRKIYRKIDREKYEKKSDFYF